ncbi:hypothetical protein [Streptomyces cinnamoneus]|uniref:Uncharacterized protein n=1 Tax=Streptomyces cinnamoneus TaxID=53446 RepID=A0A918WRW0_STRCJ|nr:hypothetical protein [Streptomyces cinnamoneus]GHC75469.1 hypothetical protein GCM10010507_63380 [Streptomyces cinnamoneus]
MGVCVPAFAGTAHAAPSSTLLFSADGGATWSSNVSTASGGTVLVRIWSHNDTGATIRNASVTTSLPSGTTLIPHSTQDCLSPSTTDPARPSGSDTCGEPVNDAAVWSGGSLITGPTAGIQGRSTTATSGDLTTGWSSVGFSMTAPYVDSTITITETAGLDGSGTGHPSSSGTITVSDRRVSL